MAQFGPSLQTAQITTGNVRTALDLYQATGILNNGAKNPLGASYYDNAVSLANPNGVSSKYRYVRYNSTANAALVAGAGPGVVYWTDETYTTVTSTSTESVSQGINAIAGVMMVSKRKFDALPGNLQESLRAASQELTSDWRKTMVAKTEETSLFLKEKGLTINEVDRAAYRKQTDGVYKEFRDVIGGDLVDAVMKQVGSA